MKVEWTKVEKLYVLSSEFWIKKVICTFNLKVVGRKLMALMVIKARQRSDFIDDFGELRPFLLRSFINANILEYYDKSFVNHKIFVDDIFICTRFQK